MSLSIIDVRWDREGIKLPFFVVWMRLLFILGDALKSLKTLKRLKILSLLGTLMRLVTILMRKVIILSLFVILLSEKFFHHHSLITLRSRQRILKLLCKEANWLSWSWSMSWLILLRSEYIGRGVLYKEWFEFSIVVELLILLNQGGRASFEKAKIILQVTWEIRCPLCMSPSCWCTSLLMAIEKWDLLCMLVIFYNASSIVTENIWVGVRVQFLTVLFLIKNTISKSS